MSAPACARRCCTCCTLLLVGILWVRQVAIACHDSRENVFVAGVRPRAKRLTLSRFASVLPSKLLPTFTPSNESRPKKARRRTDRLLGDKAKQRIILVDCNNVRGAGNFKMTTASFIALLLEWVQSESSSQGYGRVVAVMDHGSKLAAFDAPGGCSLVFAGPHWTADHVIICLADEFSVAQLVVAVTNDRLLRRLCHTESDNPKRQLLHFRRQARGKARGFASWVSSLRGEDFHAMLEASPVPPLPPGLQALEAAEFEQRGCRSQLPSQFQETKSHRMHSAELLQEFFESESSTAGADHQEMGIATCSDRKLLEALKKLDAQTGRGRRAGKQI